MVLLRVVVVVVVLLPFDLSLNEYVDRESIRVEGNGRLDYSSSSMSLSRGGLMCLDMWITKGKE